MDWHSVRRRNIVLATAGAALSSLSGCLRLTTGQTTSTPENETTTETSRGDALTLSEVWNKELLWEIFAHDNRLAGDRASRDGGYVMFIDQSGETQYTSDELGEGYTLAMKKGRAMATNGTAVYAAGRNDNNPGETPRLVAFDGNSGDQLWTRDFDTDGQQARLSHVCADETQVYCVIEQELEDSNRRQIVRAVSAESGSSEWEQVYDKSFVRGLTVHDGRVIVGFSQDLHILDAPTGTESAHASIDGSASQGFTRVDDTVYIADTKIRAYDAQTGEQQWSIKRDREVETRITVADGMLYAGTSASYLTAHDLTEQSKRWEVRLEQAVETKPAVTSTAVFVADSIGAVSAVQKATGNVVYGPQRLEERPERTTVATLGDFVCISGLTTDGQFTRGFEVRNKNQ